MNQYRVKLRGRFNPGWYVELTLEAADRDQAEAVAREAYAWAHPERGGIPLVLGPGRGHKIGRVRLFFDGSLVPILPALATGVGSEPEWQVGFTHPGGFTEHLYRGDLAAARIEWQGYRQTLLAFPRMDGQENASESGFFQQLALTDGISRQARGILWLRRVDPEEQGES